MAPNVKTYDPSKVVFVFGGIPISGYADNSFITHEMAEEPFKSKVGCDGGLTRSQSANKSSKIKVKLMASSPSNDVLSGFHTADLLKGTGVVPGILKELGGSTLVTGAECFVSKPPSISFDKEVGDREWEITIAETLMVVGGLV